MKKNLLLCAIFFSIFFVNAQKSSYWQLVSETEVSRVTPLKSMKKNDTEKYFTLNVSELRQKLQNTPDKMSNQPGTIIEFPYSDGTMKRFRVWENSNFEPALQAQFPDIRAYVGKGIDDVYATINFSVCPESIQTITFGANTTEYIEPFDKAANYYVAFNNINRLDKKEGFVCSTKDVPLSLTNNNITNKASNAKYKTMKLALSCTAEYANCFGATSAAQVNLVLAAYNATMTRVNGVYEKDLSLHLNIVTESTQVIYYNPATDPYSDGATGSGGAWNAELMNALHNTIGDTPFDIGHLFGASGGGGNAGCIGCVCSNDMTVDSFGDPVAYKGSGFTSPGDNIPQTDTFDIDYVAHEMGHQCGGNHSFTYGYEGTVAQTEPGSGSTIMGYAGITSYDVQAHSDPIFSYKNIFQIQSNLNSKTCPVTTALAGINATPVANAGADYTIPVGTAFVLTGTATDADATDVLTYIWEENDLGTSSTTTTSSRVLATKTTGPNFRTFKPSNKLERYFPQMGKILLGTIAITTSGNTNWETVSNVARTLNFTFTARDNHAGMGQTHTDASIVTVNASGGPFTVTSQSTTGISYAGLSQQIVTWNVANTTASPFNTSNVDILISTNASTALETYNATTPTTPNPTTWTVVASNVPNNGTATVTLPNVTTSTSTCRFMVKAVGNVFLAVNSKNFTITPALGTDNFGLENFTLYPNPNNGTFNISFNSSTSNDYQITVNDIRGRQIYIKNYANTGMIEQTLQLNNVEAGVYLVTVQDGARKEVKKIVIE